MGRHCSLCHAAGHYSKTCTTGKTQQEPNYNVTGTFPASSLGPTVPIVKSVVNALDAVIDENEIVFVKPRKGLWIVNEQTKKIAGKILCVRGDGTVVYENYLGATVDSSPETILSSNYTFVDLQPTMLSWYHGA